MSSNEKIFVKTNKNGENFIKIKDGNIGYLYSNEQSIGGGTTVAVLWYDDKDEPKKELFLAKKSDYILNGQAYEEDNVNASNKLEFKIEKDNLLYKPLQAFLTGKSEIVIDDDRYKGRKFKNYEYY